jgi:hypothetical protein
MQSVVLLECAGRRRSPATLPGYHRGRPPRNEGLRYPPDPPSVEEISAVMRAAGADREGARLSGLVIVFWRAGLRISEALASRDDLDHARGAILVRSGKGRSREVGMDRWAWDQLDPRAGAQANHARRRVVLHRAARRAGPPARRRRSACSYETPPPARASDAASPTTSYAMPTPSRCVTRRGYRYSSSNGNSGTPTCRSPPYISAESTTTK